MGLTARPAAGKTVEATAECGAGRAVEGDRPDLALVGGRVIDPESGLDAVTDVGISGARITHVGPDARMARRRIDCAGLVVSPGFIDLHSHAQTLGGARLQAFDGVTTALDLECGALSVRAWYDSIATQGRPVNYGYSASWAAARAVAVVGGPVPRDGHETGFDALRSVMGSTSWQLPIDERQGRQVLELLERELDDGGLGIGALVGYLPDSDPSELESIAALSARSGTATFAHSRSAARSGTPTALDAVLELIEVAERTGAHVHLCHVNSTSSRWMGEIVEAIEDACRRGTRITTECYPYARGSTVIGAAFLSADELRREGRLPSSLIYVPTGEAVADEGRLNQLRESDPAGIVMTLTYDLSDEQEAKLLDQALLVPDAAFASDAMPVSTKGSSEGQWPLPTSAFAHPRSAGTFSRVFRWLVRERGLLSIPQAVRRCTLVPALILADTSPMMRSKGRLQVGADADIVVFDPDQITDHATYSQLRPSTGVRQLLVGGCAVIIDGALQQGERPGRPILSGRHGGPHPEPA